VPADQVEALVVNALKARGLRPANLNNGRELIRSMLVRVEVAAKTIKVSAKNKDDEQQDIEGVNRQFNVSIPWSKRATKMPRELILPVSQPANAKPKPIRVEDRARLVSAIGRSRRWLRQLQDGSAASTAEIAKSEKYTLRQVNLTLSLAFLSPRLVEAAVAGRLPRGIGITSLRNLPPEWAQQHKLLGLSF